MVHKVYTGAINGMLCKLVTVEVDVSDGLPCMEMVGYLSSEVKEAKERVRVAMKNVGYRMPAKRITVNYAPADLRKDGNAYDLPTALGILLTTGLLEEDEENREQIQKLLEETLIVGELGLSGEIKPVRGVLPLVASAKDSGMKYCIVPYANMEEALLIRDIKVWGADHLEKACEIIRSQFKAGDTADKMIKNNINDKQSEEEFEHDFGEVRGQAMAKMAAEIAAAGFHNLLLVGPPGAGKSLIAKCIPSILPPMTMEESLEVSKIYSVAGLIREKHPLITKRVVQSPHHTVTRQALVGGGTYPKPGIISLAHRSVLFLDELPEFGRANLDLLRQPLEDKKILIARNSGNIEYPADFMLVAAMNPCPCGYYPDLNRCKCTAKEVAKYQNRVSGPMLDRFDLVVRVDDVGMDELSDTCGQDNSAMIRERVLAAREIQKERFGDCKSDFNSEMTNENIKKYCNLQKKEETFLKQIYEERKMSARAYYRTLRVARTIADLSGSKNIRMEHIAQAVCFHGNLDG